MLSSVMFISEAEAVEIARREELRFVWHRIWISLRASSPSARARGLLRWRARRAAHRRRVAWQRWAVLAIVPAVFLLMWAYDRFM